MKTPDETKRIYLLTIYAIVCTVTIILAESVSYIVYATGNFDSINRGVQIIVFFAWAHSLSFYIGTAIFLRWIFVSYRNIKNSGEGMKYAPGEAILRFFVPYINLFVPYEVVSEISLKYKYVGRKENFSQYQPIKLVAIWWIMYLIGSLFYTILLFGGHRILYGGGLGSAFWNLLSSILRIATGTLLLYIMIQIRAEEKNAFLRYSETQVKGEKIEINT